MVRSTMGELLRVATAFQQTSGKHVVIEPQDAANKKVVLRIDMGNGINLGMGICSKLEAIKILIALTMYVDCLKPQLPKAYITPGPAAVANLFTPAR